MPSSHYLLGIWIADKLSALQPSFSWKEDWKRNVLRVQMKGGFAQCFVAWNVGGESDKKERKVSNNDMDI